MAAIHDFIKERKFLIWYVKDYDRLKAESIVEATLNYGDWDDVQELIRILGIKRVARIFREQISRPRKNYDVKILNYFKLYFEQYA